MSSALPTKDGKRLRAAAGPCYGAGEELHRTLALRGGQSSQTYTTQTNHSSDWFPHSYLYSSFVADQMDEHISKRMEFSTLDERAEFWRVRTGAQDANHPKVYLFPSLLEWLSEGPQSVLNSALARKENTLSIPLPNDLAVAVQKECAIQKFRGDALALYIGGYSATKPSSQELAEHLQRSYMEACERKEHRRPRQLVSIIDASLLLGLTQFAVKLCEENKYDHDLLHLLHSEDGDEVWDDYKTSVMLRLSRGGVPSPESLEAARITGLLCDMMAGPAARRRSAVAKMAANGLKLDAMVLAKLFFSNNDICEHLSNECSNFFKKSAVDSDADEVAEMVATASEPVFERQLLRCTDQLSCYRILRIDFALNEHADLERKLVGRLELSKHVRYVIAHALAYRNYEVVSYITEDAVAHLDRYSFFCELEQIVYKVAIGMICEAVRMVFHAEPASVGWKKQRDEKDKLGYALQQHPNGYIGGLMEMWTKRSLLAEVARAQDSYRQRSLLSSISGIASVLRDDTLLDPMCRGLLIFACGLVHSALEALFGRCCQKLDELIETNPCLDYNTGVVLIRKLTRGVLSSPIDENLRSVLNTLCDLSIGDTLRLNRDAVLPSNASERLAASAKATRTCDSRSDTEALKKVSVDVTPERRPKEPEGGSRDVSTRSGGNSDMNDNSSVAPSRSVCEQVATMMEGVKYCRERESTKNVSHSRAAGTKPTRESPVKVKEQPTATGFGSSAATIAVDQAKTGAIQEGHLNSTLPRSSLKSEGVKKEAESAKTQMREEANLSSEDSERPQIISDDLLDFSSSAQDPSVKTKWLPEEDITIGQAPKAEVDSKPTHQAATLRNAANVDDINEEKAGVEPRNESEAHEDFPSESIEKSKRMKNLDAGDSTDSDSDWDYNDGEDGCTSSAKELYFGTSAISPEQVSIRIPWEADGIPWSAIKQPKTRHTLSPAITQDSHVTGAQTAMQEFGRKCSKGSDGEETHLTELPRIDLDGVEKKNPLHKQVVGKGKAMIQKLLTESNSANSRPRYGTERLHISSVNGREKTHSFDDFIDRETDQMSPFRATRENVFCTSSQESVIDSANASFDDDIAGAFSHASETVCRPDVKREGSPVDSQYSKRPALDQQVKQEPLSTSPEIRDAQPTANASKARLPVKTKETGGADVEGRAVRYANDRWSSDEDENRFSSSAGFVSTNDEDKEAMLERKEEHETVKHQSPSSNRTCKREESEEEFSKTRGDDPSFGGSARVLEPVSEKTEELGDEDRASEHSAPPRSEPACFAERSRERDEIAKDRTAENFKERQPPKKFNIGGFGSPDAAGFGTSSFSSIGKENVAAFGSIDLFGEDKGGRGYGGDRGFGRGDQRGGARGGGRGFDRDGPRSRDNRGGSFRDRDGGRDGNRERGPRDGGYYDGDGYRGRGGFNGGRNEGRSGGYRGGRN